MQIKNNPEILFDIPRAGLKIYPNFMVIFPHNNHKNVCEKSIGCISTSELINTYNFHGQVIHSNYEGQLDNYQVEHEKIKIQFSDNDSAFYVDDDNYKLLVYQLKSYKLSEAQLITTIQFQDQFQIMGIANFFRKKIIEVGFDQKYRIIEKIGKGATADVFLVERKKDQVKFAAKIISINKEATKAYESFINQSKILKIVNHPNIIHLESLFINDNHVIQVLEYLSGGHLLKILKDDELRDSKESWKAIQDIVEGLQHLRQKRIIHRDLKLENILVRVNKQNRDLVISDFGLAVWVGEKHPAFQRCGTPGYIAPQILNDPQQNLMFTHKCDIFSLGVIAHLILLYRPLFPYDGNIKQLLYLNKKAKYSLKGNIYKSLKSKQHNFLLDSLAKKPEQRSSSQTLLINYFDSYKPQRSKRIKRQRKTSLFDEQRLGVEVKTKKQLSMTKKNLSLDMKGKATEQRSNSAKKAISNFFNNLISPSPQKIGLKVKQNSREKHKKMIEFC